MNKEQEVKFEEYLCKHGADSNTILGFRREAWQACLEANGIGEERLNHAEPDPDHPGIFRAAIREEPHIPEEYFKIGEDVQIDSGAGLYNGTIVAKIRDGGFVTDAEHVRRIPAWKPKDGPVLYRTGAGYTAAGILTNGYVYVGRDRFNISDLPMKPFDESKLGWKWDEV